MLKKILLATTATALLATAATPAMAQQADSNAAVETGIGLGAGATTGAITGGIIGGPIGAVIGGFAGATLGAAATVPEPVSTYAVANPVEPVYFDADVTIGSQVGTDVQIYEVPDSPDYGYFYANGRAYVVDRNSMEVVYSPGYAIPEETMTYVSANPTASVIIPQAISASASSCQRKSNWRRSPMIRSTLMCTIRTVRCWLRPIAAQLSGSRRNTVQTLN